MKRKKKKAPLELFVDNFCGGGLNMVDPIKRYENYLEKLIEQGSIFDKDTRICRICGCTQHNACSGGCYWVTDDLCSQCLKFSGTDIDPVKREDMVHD